MMREGPPGEPKSRTGSEKTPNSWSAAAPFSGAGDYTIGPFRLQREVRALFRHAEPLPLSQRAVALLHLMVERHGELVSKDTLMEAAWNGQIVEESNLTVQIASLRRVLGSESGGERWVETLPRRGYRYVGPERVLEPVREPRPAAPASPPAERPSIVVVPFQNLNGDPQQSYLGEGFAEDLTAALSRLKWLVVIARAPAEATAGEGVRPLMPARRARYLLAGSTRLVGERIRVSCRVEDTETSQTIFARRYDRRLDDIFAMQDDITESLIAVIEPSLLQAEATRYASRPVERLDAWGLIARAVGLLHRFERQPNAVASGLLAKAVEIEPGNARAHATLAWAKYWAQHCTWRQDRDACTAEALKHAQTALRFDPQEPWARTVYGFNLSSVGRHEEAVTELRRALDIHPCFALGRMLLGWALLRKGDNDEAVAESLRALMLSADDRTAAVYQHTHGLALLAARRFEEALPFLRAAAAAYVEYMGHVNAVISCCGHLGLLDEARRLIEFREAALGFPFTVSYARVRLSAYAHCDVFLEGLAKAGLPE